MKLENVKLKYHSCQTIVSCPSTSVIVLTDAEETRQLTIICDSYTRLQIAVQTNQIDPDNIQFRVDEDMPTQSSDDGFRDDLEGMQDSHDEESGANSMEGREGEETNHRKKQAHRSQLPEVLCGIIQYMTNMRLGIIIYNIYDGVYKASIIDYNSGTRFPISITDAVMLNIANPHIPLTADATLWKYQSVPFRRDGIGVSMPINTLTVPMLSRALRNAIDDERYEEAKTLKEELDRRNS